MKLHEKLRKSYKVACISVGKCYALALIGCHVKRIVPVGTAKLNHVVGAHFPELGKSLKKKVLHYGSFVCLMFLGLLMKVLSVPLAVPVGSALNE